MKKEALGAWSGRLRALLERYKFLLLVILVGVVLLLLPTGDKKTETAALTAAAGERFDVADMEQKLARTLTQINGVGEVSVMLTLRSSALQVLAQDGKTTEKEGDSEANITTVVVSKGSGYQETVALQQLSPQYQGALVVCSGGDDPNLRLRLTEAVSALTGLGADKISICKSSEGK